VPRFFFFLNLEVPFHNVETRDSILATHSIEVAPKNCYSNTGPAGAGGGHIAAPLIGLRIVPRETHQTAQIACLGMLQTLPCLGTTKAVKLAYLELKLQHSYCELDKTPEEI